MIGLGVTRGSDNVMQIASRAFLLTTPILVRSRLNMDLVEVI